MGSTRRGMATGSIRKNASGSWQARLRLLNGDRVSLGSFRSKIEAQRALALAVGESSKGTLVDPRAGRVSFAAYADEWLTNHAGLRPRTVELYESQLRVHLVPVFGRFEIADISPVHVRRWFAELARSKTTGPTTAAKVYRLLRAILNTATSDELIPRNPCNLKGAGAERSAERPIATIDQVERLAATIDPRYRVLVLLATYTTLRYGELFALRRKHIDLRQRRISVVAQVSHLATGELILGPPKSAAGRRVVSFPASLKDEIAGHLNRYVADAPDAFVFRSPSGVVPRRSNWSTMWRRVTKAAGIEGLHFHDLRHTGNTLAASTGASTRELMARMGHASPRAALIYQHATREREDDIAAGLDVMLRQRSVSSDGAARHRDQR